VARATAIKARTQAANALRALLVTALPSCVSSCATLTRQACRHGGAAAPRAILTPTAATKLALGTVAERQLALTAELTTLDAELDRLTARRRRRCGSYAGSALRSLGRWW
jgi:transposase